MDDGLERNALIPWTGIILDKEVWACYYLYQWRYIYPSVSETWAKVKKLIMST